MPDPERTYNEAVAEARQRLVQGGLTAEVVQNIREALARSLLRLQNEAEAGRLTPERLENLRQSLDRALQQYRDEAVVVLEQGRRDAIQLAVEGHTQGLESVAEEVPQQAASIAVGESFTEVADQVLEVQARRRAEGVAETMQTLVNRSVQGAADDIDTQLERIVDQGVDNETVAEDIARLLAQGNPELQETLDDMGRGTDVDIDPDADPIVLDEDDFDKAQRVEYEARRIAVSETNSHYHEADVVAGAESPVVDLLRWRTSINHTGEKRYVPDICDVMEEADLYGYGPGLFHPAVAPSLMHPHCVVPETEVEASCSRAIRSEYHGEVVKITTRSGNNLTITPKHPIPAIGRGWVPASSLSETDQLIRYRRDRDVGPFESEHVCHGPVTAEEAFHTIAEEAPSFSVEVSANDFHGDGRRVDGNVDVVGVNGALLRDAQALRVKGGRDGLFMLAQRVAAILSSTLNPQRTVPLLFGIERLSSSRFMGWINNLVSSPLGPNSLPSLGLSFRLPANLDASLFEPSLQNPSRNTSVSCERLHRLAFCVTARKLFNIADLRPILFGRAPYSDTPGVETPAYRGLRNTEFVGDALLRSSAPVLTDDVINVEVKRHDGYVYDLEAMSGCMIANNLLISNCQCRYEDVLKAPEDYGTGNRDLPDELDVSRGQIRETMEGIDGERSVTDAHVRNQTEMLEEHAEAAEEVAPDLMGGAS
jgi:CRISPR/Cas system-associated endoribonuclease Cas2